MRTLAAPPQTHQIKAGLGHRAPGGLVGRARAAKTAWRAKIVDEGPRNIVGRVVGRVGGERSVRSTNKKTLWVCGTLVSVCVRVRARTQRSARAAAGKGPSPGPRAAARALHARTRTHTRARVIKKRSAAFGRAGGLVCEQCGKCPDHRRHHQPQQSVVAHYDIASQKPNRGPSAGERGAKDMPAPHGFCRTSFLTETGSRGPTKRGAVRRVCRRVRAGAHLYARARTHTQTRPTNGAHSCLSLGRGRGRCVANGSARGRQRSAHAHACAKRRRWFALHGAHPHAKGMRFLGEGASVCLS